MRAFVTLLPMIACVTPRSAPPQWIQIAAVSGDKAEAERQLERSFAGDPTGAYLAAKRWDLKAPAPPPPVEALTKAKAEELAALATKHPALRRAVLLRLMQLERPDLLGSIDASPMTAAIAAQMTGDVAALSQALAKAAEQPLPSDEDLRSFALLERLRRPESTKKGKAGWQALAVLRGPNEALRRTDGAPTSDCLARVTMALANEELGRRAAAAQSLEGVTCLDARLHKARLMSQLQPAEATASLIALLDEAPLNGELLRTLRSLQSVRGDLQETALARLVAWHPGDHNALRDQLTVLERHKEWAAASQLCDRALRARYNDQLHLLALRYLALSGADDRHHARNRELEERLDWLRKRAPGLKEIAQVDALLAGATEEGGALGAAQLQLNED